MTTTKNQRTIPTTEGFKKSIIEGKGAVKVNDIVYMYLQSISNRNQEEAHRYVKKADLNITEITGKNGVLKISRKTYYNKLNELKEIGLIEENELYYTLKNPETFFLIPHETLVYLLTNGVAEGVFKIFAWLGNRNKIMEGNVVFSQNILIEDVLAENKTSQPQHKRVKYNLDLLQRLGLIRVVKETTAKGNEVYKMTAFSSTIGGLDNMEIKYNILNGGK